MQQEGQAFSSEIHSERQVGMKAKREDENGEDEGVEWEEEQPAGILSLFSFQSYNLGYIYACSDSKLGSWLGSGSIPTKG